MKSTAKVIPPVSTEQWATPASVTCTVVHIGQQYSCTSILESHNAIYLPPISGTYVRVISIEISVRSMSTERFM